MTLGVAFIIIARILLAYIFLRAALHKAGNLRLFTAQLGSYRLLPRNLAPAAAVLLLLVEGGVAFTLPVPGWRIPAFVAAGLLALYALAMGINLARGRAALDCGCSGRATAAQTVSPALVIRNAVLVVIALLAATPFVFRAPPLQDMGTVVLAGIAVVLVYGSIEQAIANQQRQRRYFELRTHAESSRT